MHFLVHFVICGPIVHIYLHFQSSRIRLYCSVLPQAVYFCFFHDTIYFLLHHQRKRL
jgi:hypothetical protein